MDGLRRVFAKGMVAGTIAVAAGLLVLLLHMAVLMLTLPGTTFEGAYYQGSLPWIPIAFGLILGGLSAISVFGLARSWLRGPWLARLAVLVPAGGAMFWWWYALQTPRRAVPCNPGECPPPGPPDPVAVAYSIPELLLLYLILPTLAIVAISWLADRRSRGQLPR